MANDLLNLVRDANAKALGGPRNKYILYMIADRASKQTGLAWPGIQRLAWESGYSRGTVIAATRYLRKCGALIEIHRPSAPRGLTRVHRVNGEYLRSIPDPFQKPKHIGLVSKPIEDIEIGSEFETIERRNVGATVAPWVQSTDAISSDGDTSQVRNANVMGPGVGPQPPANPNLNPLRQPEPSSWKAESFRALQTLDRRSRENPDLLEQDNFIQEACDLVGKIQSPEAFRILDGMLNRGTLIDFDDSNIVGNCNLTLDDDPELHPLIEDFSDLLPAFEDG